MTLVSDDRCYILHQFAKHCLHLPGDFAECGVYKGGTALLCAQTLAEYGGANKKLHLFDSFQGMPADADDDASGHTQGDFGDTSLAAVQRRLAGFDNVHFHPGYIPSTLEAVSDLTFAYVYADLDLYKSTFDAISFFYPRMVSGAVFICDDYGLQKYKNAAKKAIDEFFSDKPEQVIVLKTGQCVALKL